MSVGAQLQHARSERRLSLADVTKETKIQPWVLEALEADRLPELMSPIYVKGFLTTYAKFLHVDPEALVAQLRWPQAATLQGSTPPTPQESQSMPVTVSFPEGFARRMAVSLAVAVCVVGIMVLKPLHHRSLHTSKAKAAPTLAATPRLASIITAPVSEPEVAKPLLPQLALLQSEPLELEISADHTTWVRLKADGKLLAQQRLLRGAHNHWTAKKRFELIVSKPSQIELTLNGQSITPFAIAHDGHLLITRHGITRLPDDEQ